MTQEALKKMQWHVLTQTQYDALETKNPNDVYAIVDDKGDYTETKLNKMIFNVMSADTYKALETKDPNQIYYVTGENEIIEHKSWTDGTQASVTPAGFTDSGFRCFYLDSTDADGNYGPLPTDPDVVGADSLEKYDPSGNADTKYSTLLTMFDYTDNDYTKHFLNGEYSTKDAIEAVGSLCLYNTYIYRYTIDLSLLTKLDAFFEFDFSLESSWYNGYEDDTDTDGSTTVNPNSANTAIILFYHLEDGKKIIDIVGCSSDGFTSGTYYKYIKFYDKYYIDILTGNWADSGHDAVIMTVNVYPMNAPYADKAVQSQINDYNAIATELTARGNTITSLNTQGQNLVAAYNNLADKYNTAGIIVTED